MLVRYSELRAELEHAGYAQRAPTPQAEEMDRPIVEQRVCAHCSAPLAYKPFMAHDGRRTFYRAFAVCEHCDTAEEF